jgi:hypothetical protein
MKMTLVSRRISAVAVPVAILAAGPPARSAEPAVLPGTAAPPPIFKEHRYRMSAAIRPLFFWIGDGDVGGARIVWRQGPDGREAYEFLLGSDPQRAPRRINRWGWVLDERDRTGAIQIGLMRKTEAKSVEEARAQAGLEGDYVFKMIRTRVANGEARSENTVWLLGKDYTYYDLPQLLQVVSSTPQTPPKVNEVAVAPGTEPGFLFAVADLVNRVVAAATATPRELFEDVSTPFTFNGALYDLRLRKTEWEASKEYGDHRYQNLVRIELESHNRKLDTTEQFTLVCGTEGRWKGVPVYVKYQPKWWFKTEGVIDESQTFEEPSPGDHRLDARNERPEAHESHVGVGRP